MLSRRVKSVVVMACMGVVVVGGLPGLLWAAEEKSKAAPGVVDQVGTAIKNAATRLEHEVTDVVKKLEDSETPKKVGNELRRSAEAVGEKVEQAGKKLKESFKSE